VLRWFARAGHLEPAVARDMAGWDHGGGFSLDASVRIDGHDRAGRERLLRYCARPPFALERLEQVRHDQLVYHFPKPQPDGSTQLRLTPLERGTRDRGQPGLRRRSPARPSPRKRGRLSVQGRPGNSNAFRGQGAPAQVTPLLPHGWWKG
jgi:hypothetical protein